MSGCIGRYTPIHLCIGCYKVKKKEKQNKKKLPSKKSKKKGGKEENNCKEEDIPNGKGHQTRNREQTSKEQQAAGIKHQIE